MDMGSLLLGLALLLLVAFIVARPLLQRQSLPAPEARPADHRLAEHESLLTALRDLDFDHATGKLTDEDYAPQRAHLVAQGVALLKHLDALGLAQQRADPEDAIERAVAARRKSRPARSAEDHLEAEIAARRRAAPSVADRLEAEVAARRQAGSEQRPAQASGQVTCAHCGALANTGDRFCPKCGHALAARCPACAHPVQPTDRFCAACGAQLSPADALG